MKALVLKGNGRLEYATIPEPEPQTDSQYLVQVHFAGICGSDIGRGFSGGAYHYPLIMGHEFSGVVIEVPENGTIPRGTRVAVYPLLPCRHCMFCHIGKHAQCTDYDYYGSRRNGGFAEYVWVGEENLYPLPDSVSLLSAAMTEPAAVALHGVEKISIRAGMNALVIGGGPIGNMAAQWLKLKGCDPVFLADIDDKKLAVAESLDIIPLNSKESAPAEHLKKRGFDGSDCVVEACGLPQTFSQAIESCATFGQVVFMGNIHGTFKLDEKQFSSILRKELSIRGTWNSDTTPRGNDDWTKVLQFLDRNIKVRPLISHRIPLKDGAMIFKKIAAKEIWYNKVIFSIAGEG